MIFNIEEEVEEDMCARMIVHFREALNTSYSPFGKCPKRSHWTINTERLSVFMIQSTVHPFMRKLVQVIESTMISIERERKRESHSPTSTTFSRYLPLTNFCTFLTLTLHLAVFYENIWCHFDKIGSANSDVSESEIVQNTSTSINLRAVCASVWRWYQCWHIHTRRGMRACVRVRLFRIYMLLQ